MQRSSQLCTLAVLTALWGSGCAEQPHAIEQWSVSKIKECVIERLDIFLADFKAGSLTCPRDCANCFPDPMSCLQACTDKGAACGCAEALPEAISYISECCDDLWGIFQGACEGGLRGLEETVVGQISHICKRCAESLDVGPGALLENTRRTVEESTTAFLVGLQAAAQRRPGASALLDLQLQHGNASSTD